MMHTMNRVASFSRVTGEYGRADVVAIITHDAEDPYPSQLFRALSVLAQAAAQCLSAGKETIYSAILLMQHLKGHLPRSAVKSQRRELLDVLISAVVKGVHR